MENQSQEPPHLSFDLSCEFARACVVFTDSSSPIIRHALKKGFSHVSIIVELADCCVAHSLDFGRMTSALIDCEIESFAKRFKGMNPGHTVCLVECEHQPKTFVNTKIMSCVNVCAYMLGITLPFHVQTPYAFYKYLRRARWPVTYFKEI